MKLLASVLILFATGAAAQSSDRDGTGIWVVVPVSGGAIAYNEDSVHREDSKVALQYSVYSQQEREAFGDTYRYILVDTTINCANGYQSLDGYRTFKDSGEKAGSMESRDDAWEAIPANSDAALFENIFCNGARLQNAERVTGLNAAFAQMKAVAAPTNGRAGG